ncbi:MAG: VCBS repeat-containing protein [Cyclobacteriaceae bacterium]|nr:VCBS repeat-containing protein [Cyclobacteriaceae bacterium]
MEKKIISWLLFFALSAGLTCTRVYSQVPVIHSLDKKTGTAEEFVTIRGSGFNTNPAQNVIFFGASTAETLSASASLLEVKVPAGTSFSHVSVTNLVSGRTGYANERFLLAHGGDVFDPSRFDGRLELTEEAGLFDVCACDFDGDGRVDIVTTNNAAAAASTSVTVFRNVTTAEQSTISMQRINESNLNIFNPARNIFCADLNGDGKPDIVAGRGGNTADRLYVFRNTGSPGNIRFAAPVSIVLAREAVSSTTRRIRIMDLDGDGLPEIVMTDQNDNKVHIFVNKSSGNTLRFPELDKILLTTNDQTLGLDIADMDGDGKKDLIFGSNLRSDIFIARNVSSPGNVSFNNPHRIQLNGNLVNLVTADFNGNGKSDIAVVNFVNNIFIIPNNSSAGNFSFASPIFVETNRLPWGIAVGDLDGDGRPDLVVSSTDAGQRSIALINRSLNNSYSFQSYPIGNNEPSRNIALVDFNGNGKTDLVYTVDDINRVVFLRNRNCVNAIITPGNPGPICGGQPVLLSGRAAPKSDYIWKNALGDEVLTNSNQFSVSIPGTYTYTISSSADVCESTSTQVEVAAGGSVLPALPVINAPLQICESNELIISTLAVPGASYHWTLPGGGTSSQREISIPSAGPEHSGRYTLEIESSDGCRTAMVSKTIEVNLLPPLVIAASQSTVFCEGESNVLSVNTVAGATYQWFKNGDEIIGANTFQYDVIESGSYKVQLSSSLGCNAESNTFTTRKVMQIQAAFNVVEDPCLNQPLIFENQSQYDTDEEVFFFWDFDGRNFSREKTPNYTYSQSGTFRPRLTVSYERNTCLSEIEKTIVVSAAPALSIKAGELPGSPDQVEICQGDSILLTVINSGAAFSWENGSQNQQRLIKQAGIYSITSTGVGCKSTDQVEVIVRPIPNVKVISENIRINPGGAAQLGASGADVYSWSPAEDLDRPNASNPIARPDVTTTFIVTGSNTFNCTSSDKITVIVDESKRIAVDADKLLVAGTGPWIIRNIEDFEGCTINIVDRNGRSVFQSSSYQNNWDGTMNGSPLPSGTYYYLIKCASQDVSTGFVTIVK